MPVPNAPGWYWLVSLPQALLTRKSQAGVVVAAVVPAAVAAVHLAAVHPAAVAAEVTSPRNS